MCPRVLTITFDEAEMISDPKLPIGIVLVKSDIFWPEGRFYFVRGEEVWSKTQGWVIYYKVRREDCYFETEELAMQAWQGSGQ